MKERRSFRRARSCRRRNVRATLLGHEESSEEERRHGDQQSVSRRTAAADALLQFGDLGVKLIWETEKEKGTEGTEGRKKILPTVFLMRMEDKSHRFILCIIFGPKTQYKSLQGILIMKVTIKKDKTEGGKVRKRKI